MEAIILVAGFVGRSTFPKGYWWNGLSWSQAPKLSQGVLSVTFLLIWRRAIASPGDCMSTDRKTHPELTPDLLQNEVWIPLPLWLVEKGVVKNNHSIFFNKDRVKSPHPTQNPLYFNYRTGFPPSLILWFHQNAHTMCSYWVIPWDF